MQTDAVGESGIGENVNQNDTDHADKAGAVVQDESVSSDAKWTEDAAEDETAFAESGSTEDFEPVITHDDADEDTQAGDVNRTPEKNTSRTACGCIRQGSDTFRCMTVRSINGQI